MVGDRRQRKGKEPLRFVDPVGFASPVKVEGKASQQRLQQLLHSPHFEQGQLACLPRAVDAAAHRLAAVAAAFQHVI